MHSPNTLAAAVLICCAGLSVFSLTSCADPNSPTGDANAPTQTKTRAEVKAELNQALMNGWHIDKGD